MINLQRYRWAVRLFNTALFILLPFITINGQSALRFDIPSLRLFFFGTSVWIENFFIVLIFTFFITFLGILVTQLYGRIWCGWFCPHTVMINLTWFFDRKKQTLIQKVISHILVFAISTVISVTIVFYFVSPYDFFRDLAAGTLSPVTAWFCIVITAITYLSFVLIRYKFCTTVCPYSKLQSIMFDKNTLIVAFDPATADRCIKCNACVKTCPVGLDIRKGLVSACINCGRCITACAKVMKKKEHPSLVHYIYGFEKEKKPFRVNVLITAMVTLVFFSLFVWMAATTKPFEFQVLPNQKFMPREKDDRIINSYELIIKNISDKELTFDISVEGTDDYELQYEKPFSVKPAETVKRTAFLFIEEEELEHIPILSL
ncbi:4Fe-4S dicluster domain-containing protein, partial [Seleniivibrio woodruffii]|uniref:4Fe-4S dicluster domain-containing protein n=1 Tax=Seleniivibrio woodruffii TaxID=1078050 RepID=UPI0039E58102